MAIIGNNANTLLHGLSDFWHRYFRDIGDVQAAYEGTEILLGQVYLNLLNDVLNLDVRETPLFRKEYYKLLTIREDQLKFYDTGNSATDRYVFTSDVSFTEVPQIQNKVFAPTAAMEPGQDYAVVGSDIRFNVDPTAPVLNGYAYRTITIPVGGFFSDVSTPTGIEKGDVLYVSATQDLTGVVPSNTLAAYRIIHIDNGLLTLAVETPSPSFPVGAEPAGFSWRIERTLANGTVAVIQSVASFTGQFFDSSSIQVTEISLWAVDAQVDDFSLYTNYGHIFSDEKRASTEAYRAFIRGMMQLYVFGPAIDRVESAMNVAAGFPVVRDDDEILQSYDLGAVVQTVTTDKQTYEYPTTIPLRDDVKGSANFGVLTFKAFEPLTTAIRVVDYIKDPEWWLNIIIPEALLPGSTEERRTVSQELYPLLIGDSGHAYIGDPGFYIGADEFGDASVATPYRHSAAYILMDRFLKKHMFGVFIDASVDVTSDLITDLTAIIKDLKPAHTFLYFAP